MAYRHFILGFLGSLPKKIASPTSLRLKSSLLEFSKNSCSFFTIPLLMTFNLSLLRGFSILLLPKNKGTPTKGKLSFKDKFKNQNELNVCH